jgi:hypothetical protein
MVTISESNNKFIFKINGLHQIWALKSKLIIDKENIVSAYQNPDELNHFKGFRVGTHIPFLITAGTFSWKGKRNFWDVTRQKNTIIVVLKNNIYNKLYLEVKNQEAALHLLNTK